MMRYWNCTWVVATFTFLYLGTAAAHGQILIADTFNRPDNLTVSGGPGQSGTLAPLPYLEADPAEIRGSTLRVARPGGLSTAFGAIVPDFNFAATPSIAVEFDTNPNDTGGPGGLAGDY